ncbi:MULTISPECIES: YbeU/YbeR family protein [Halomonadaceae]|uniref:DUF1266 domain-containing protein n=1 Tax=Halomonadaceae TaxID=28256 RepID=UPI001599A6B1|nr:MULTISPECIES: YbeU/YbeR family protein [Halomonas]QJQ95752.1 YbeU/YbeR family protein [Halomonas sp. PA5]
MVDPLNAWWAQQLVLCGWAFEPDPTAVEVDLAASRLQQLGVADRSELGWRLMEAFAPEGHDPARQLASLELIALAVAAGWMALDQGRAWAQCLARTICSRYSDLDSWLQALLQVRSAEGWVRGDDGFYESCQALATLEHDGEGITWEMVCLHLAKHGSADAELWPAAPGQACWRLRAAFAPTLGLPPAAGLDWPEVGNWLHDVWQISDREGLIRLMLWLAGQGDRYGWDVDAARLLEADAETRLSWAKNLKGGEGYGRVMLTFLGRGEALEWAAWDWLRLVELAHAGWCMEWLDEAEAGAFAAHAADLLIRRYSDWVALVHAYQRGRSLFEGGDCMGDMTHDWALLLHSPVSPWREPLQSLLDDQTRQRSREAMRGWRRDARHWTLTLASLRDPDLLYRQGPPPAMLDPARRDDARSYLRETLSLFPDDGVAGLTRYWLPAQAHYLNQLAADASHNALPSAATPFGHPDPAELAQRDRLASCSRHAATIHMAEKYAFYLQMAMDSEVFSSQGLAELAESLRGVLCRFYADSRRLLDAWAAWEAVLPEGEGPTLVHDIRWHRDDPGSPFHWLDWQPAAWREPGRRPTLLRFTALALVGPLNASAWSEPFPESEREREAIRDWLDSHYGLQSSQSLGEFLDFLLSSGDRQEYQINYAPYTLNRARLEAEIAILESGECDEEERNHLLRLKRARDNEHECNEIDMTAWDIAQAVDLAVAGRQLNWLNEEAFDEALERAMELAAAHYSGWGEYARGLFAGFSFFMGETPERNDFLTGFRQALVSWLTGAPPLSGAWASLDFPGARPRHWAPLHIDTLPGDARTLH